MSSCDWKCEATHKKSQFDPTATPQFAQVWFSSVPLAAVVSPQLAPMWRDRFMAAFTLGADTLAFAVLVHLLWPSRRGQYTALTSSSSGEGGGRGGGRRQGGKLLSQVINSLNTFSDSNTKVSIFAAFRATGFCEMPNKIYFF